MNCIVEHNSLQLPFGTKFSIRHGLVNKQLNLINGCKQNEFFAIFDENDIDFEIWCDNINSDRGVGIDLVVNGQLCDTNGITNSFYIAPQKLSKFKALESNGRKLHFLSQNCDDGRYLVAQTANKYGISYEMASIICSKVKIHIQVEQCLNKTNDISLIGNEKQVFVKTLTGKTKTIDIGLNNTVNDLKMIIAKREGIDSNEQRLIYDGEQLVDYRQMAYYHITNGSTFQLLLLCGGKDLLCVKSESDTSSTGSSTSNNDANASSGASQLFSGERGVVCYGEPSNEEFKPYYGFEADSNITVNSIVIEMRMESRFAPI